MTVSNIDELRTERNARLAACDYAMLPDFIKQLPEGEIEALKLYRQTLRDLPARYADVEGDIETVDWPEQPAFSLRPEVPFTVTEESE